MANTWVVVDRIPDCDMCKLGPYPRTAPAYADGKTEMGPWANMCQPCFDHYGIGLGLGLGQELLLPGNAPNKEADCKGEGEGDCECTFPHCPMCASSDLKFVNAPGVGSQDAMFCNNCQKEV